MKVTGKTIEALRGERWYQKITGFDWDQVTQIVVRICNAVTGQNITYTKMATEDYPEAGSISNSEDGSMLFLLDTSDLDPGKYSIEIKINVAGVNAAILKQQQHFLTVKKSNT